MNSKHTTQLAEWTTAEVNDLPDSSFSFIMPGGKKDEQGKTMPRSFRKLPYKNADGSVDLPHLRNALARLGQTNDIPQSEQNAIRAKLTKALENANQNMSEHHFWSLNLLHAEKLSESGTRSSVIEVLRVGTIQDRNLKITQQMLNDFVDHFKANTYGTPLQVDFGHNREGEAGGWISDIFLDPQNSERLMAKIDWTSLGEQKVADQLYKFVSAEFAPKYKDATGKWVNNVFIGLALTNVPALKGQSPIVLSEEIKQLTNSHNTMVLKTYITNLSERAAVSVEDKKLMHQMLDEATPEEQAEIQEQVAAVDAKPDEVKTEDKTEEQKKQEADAAAQAQAEADKAKADADAATQANATLTEKLNEVETNAQKLQEQVNKLTEERAEIKLNETFATTVQLSENHRTGLSASHKASYVALMKTLSEEQQTQVNDLLNKVTHVELGEIGAAGANALDVTKENSVNMSEDIKEAQKLSEQNHKPLHENLATIYAAREITK